MLKHVMIIVTAMVLSISAYAVDDSAPPSNGTVSKKDPVPNDSGTKVTDPKAGELKGPLSDMEKLRLEMQKLEEKINKLTEENEIRRRLETTAEEKSSGDESILSAAGRDYTLMKPGNMGFEFDLTYTGDAFDSVTTSSGSVTSVNHNAFHTVSTGCFIEYPVQDNLTVTFNLPFVYKYSSETNSSTAKDTSDLGDVSLGCQFQPVKSGGDLPSVILSGSLICPSGRSPYKIDTTRELSTGNGGYSVNMGCNLSQSVDPVVVFGGIQIGHSFEIDNLHYQSGSQGESGIYLSSVRPGDVYSYSMGIGYSLSYKVNLTMAYQYSYQTKTSYHWVGTKDTQSEGTISSQFSIGTGWNITPKKSMNVKVGIGLTTNDPAFSVSVRIPFTYVL